MALSTDRAIPAEDTFNLLRERAAKEGDNFTIKVQRRAFANGPPDLIATLSGASVEHFVNPEHWIPPLCGGGNFAMQGYHSTDLGKPVGGFIQIKIQKDTKEVDPSVVGKSDWRGPAVLDFPQREPVREDGGPAYSVRPPPAPGDYGSARSATGSPTASWTSRQAGGDVHREQYGAETSWQAGARALEAERRVLEKERLEAKDQKHRDELESLKKQHDADMRAFKAEIMSELRAKPTGPDPSSTMLETVMKMQAENARQAAEDRRERDKQAAEDRRAAELRQDRADDRMAKLLEKMTDRPKEDPLAMIEKVSGILGKNNSNDAQMKVFHSMAEMQSMQANTTMDFIQAFADMQLGAKETESPVIKAVEAGVKALGAMARGSAAKQAAPQVGQSWAQPVTQIPAQAQPQQQAPQAAQHIKPAAPPSILVQIEYGIRGKAPVDQVAKALINHISDPSIIEAFTAAGSDFEVLVNNRLGIWAKEHVENEAYLKTLIDEVYKQFRAAGMMPEPETEEAAVEEEQGEPEGDEGDDE